MESQGRNTHPEVLFEANLPKRAREFLWAGLLFLALFGGLPWGLGLYFHEGQGFLTFWTALILFLIGEPVYCGLKWFRKDGIYRIVLDDIGIDV